MSKPVVANQDQARTGEVGVVRADNQSGGKQQEAYGDASAAGLIEVMFGELDAQIEEAESYRCFVCTCATTSNACGPTRTLTIPARLSSSRFFAVHCLRLGASGLTLNER